MACYVLIKIVNNCFRLFYSCHEIDRPTSRRSSAARALATDFSAALRPASSSAAIRVLCHAGLPLFLLGDQPSAFPGLGLELGLTLGLLPGGFGLGYLTLPARLQK
jgi:hypothetical protein